jgi:hypothetical protein
VTPRTAPPCLAELNRGAVLVVTDAGLPVSFGRLIVTCNGAVAVRVDLEFETERLQCVLRISPEKWPNLTANWDGESTRYIVPHGDGFWLDERGKHKRRITAEFLRNSTAEPAKPVTPSWN